MFCCFLGLQTPKSQASRFFDVLQSRKMHSTFTENLMLFLSFSGPFRKNDPKMSINDRFYKVFWWTFLETPKRCFTNGFWCFAKSQSAFDFDWKPNVVDTFRGHFAKMTPKVSMNARFYNVFWWTLWKLQNVVLPIVFWCFAKWQNAFNFYWKPNAFLILFGAISQKWPQKYQ